MDIFNVIAEPTRRHIMEILARKGKLTATDIYDEFNVSHPAISQHLKVLREVCAVTVEKQGRERIYELNFEKIYEFEKWTHEMTNLWNKRLDKLDIVLKDEKKKLLINKSKKTTWKIKKK